MTKSINHKNVWKTALATLGLLGLVARRRKNKLNPLQTKSSFSIKCTNASIRPSRSRVEVGVKTN